MKKYFTLPLLLVLAMGLTALMAIAQTTGTVKGVCKDSDGKPIVQAEVEWTGLESGHVYKLKTNNKGEYFSLGIVPGKYNVKLSKDGKELFHINNVAVGLDETELPFDLKKEQTAAAQAADRHLVPGEVPEADEQVAGEDGRAPGREPEPDRAGVPGQRARRAGRRRRHPDLRQRDDCHLDSHSHSNGPCCMQGLCRDSIRRFGIFR